MTGPDDVLFGRAEIERAFTAPGERLARRGVVADVFVVGGAAMALANADAIAVAAAPAPSLSYNTLWPAACSSCTGRTN